jgi:hypothetical protein
VIGREGEAAAGVTLPEAEVPATVPAATEAEEGARKCCQPK